MVFVSVLGQVKRKKRIMFYAALFDMSKEPGTSGVRRMGGNTNIVCQLIKGLYNRILSDL